MISMDGKGRCMDNIFVERLWPVDMWTIGVADRLCFPRFPSQLGNRGNEMDPENETVG